ncbi:MAG TPA: histidine phosphatase family protein [Kiritimatiellia bacterium]|nr:histidine phosphatase family protein [Kiritimatiellia bacterium]HMP00345.1 histidine phosphatase family protein [Kiritimatiellia bacterium]HMP97206.1 histidine phosphatase family protein [Kiritimatiellia bacterium]
MRLWLIRHAVAVEADAFDGDDLARPLTAEGRRTAQAAFSRLARLRRGPDVVVSSQAVRARETADAFCLAFGLRDYQRSECLNPGCRFKDIRKLVATFPARTKFAALIGHEPDFSKAVSRWTADGHLNVNLKKCALVELELRKNEPAELLMVLPPDVLAGLSHGS